MLLKQFMGTRGSMVDVFISYPQRERALMLPIKQRLEALGLMLFVDVDGRLDGEATFPEALDKGVRASKAVLGCWSPLALTRPWVQTECAIGKDENKLVAVERVKLTTADVPALFYLVDRKPLSDFDGTAPHEGWAMTLSALATKLKLWAEKRSNHPEAAAVRGKIVVLERAAAAERAALVASQSAQETSEAPRLAVVSDAAERAWAAIERSVDISHYRRFERTFENDPAAFVRVIQSEARAKALERWAATDSQDADAITETLRTGLFPALQEVAEQALARARSSAEAKQNERLSRKQTAADTHQRAEQVLIARETAREKTAAEQGAAKYGAEDRIRVDAALFSPDSEAARAGWLKPGSGKTEWFKDLDIGPQMVVVPSGRLMVGADNGPREVTFEKPFAIGRFTLTFDEWDFAQAHPEWQKLTGKAPRMPDDCGWGRGKQPVIYVDWNDAKAYCTWLSVITHKAYHLPSEMEWEYACRAGSTTVFWWGDEISTDQANYNGKYIFGNGREGEFRKRTVPVDSFEPNPWGLYQVHGNVGEWCEDAYNAKARVVRGGYWDYFPEFLRSCSRAKYPATYLLPKLGFRVARVLSQAITT